MRCCHFGKERSEQYLLRQCERSEAISEDTDNVKDCHVAMLLAMTFLSIFQSSRRLKASARNGGDRDGVSLMQPYGGNYVQPKSILPNMYNALLNWCVSPEKDE
jgi:hypothetical protein